MVSLHERAKLYVITFASRTRHPLLIVKVAGEWHTKQQWLSVNLCERAQEQFQIDPARGRIHAVPKCQVTTTRHYFFAQTRSFCNLVRTGGLGSPYACDKLRPIEYFWMNLRGRLDLMQNVIERREMILHLQHGVLLFSAWPERAENDTIKPSVGREPPQREFQQGTFLHGTRTFQHA